jgi:polyketide cyclase/dehydrase/lipid transport protein
LKKIAIGVVAVIAVVAAYFGYRYWELQQLAAKYKDAKEIASATIEKDRSTWNMRIESVFAEPIDKVWAALQHPEHSHDRVPDVFRKSELVKSEGNRKTLELEVRVLSLPSQTMTAELTYDDARKVMALKTSKGLQDLDVTYQLTALAPDRTLLTYSGTAVERVSIPVPSQSIIEGALRELFVAQVHAMQKEMHPEGAAS